MARKRRMYDEAFKLQAISLAEVRGIRKAACEMDVPVPTVQGWVRQANVKAGKHLPTPPEERIDAFDWDGWRTVIASRLAAQANKGLDIVARRQRECDIDYATEADHRNLRAAVGAADAQIARVESVTLGLVNPLNELPAMDEEMADIRAIAAKAARIAASLGVDAADEQG